MSNSIFRLKLNVKFFFEKCNRKKYFYGIRGIPASYEIGPGAFNDPLPAHAKAMEEGIPDFSGAATPFRKIVRRRHSREGVAGREKNTRLRGSRRVFFFLISGKILNLVMDSSLLMVHCS